MWTGWAIAALASWVTIVLLPWRAWSTREHLQADNARIGEALDDVTVLIPARDEADVLPRTLACLAEQGPGLEILVVDDQSSDGTGEIAARCGVAGMRVISGARLPEGWTGKVWAQSQAQAYLRRPLVLLLDADIALAPGLIATLRHELRARRLGLLSLMAALSMRGFWERLLLPAFVFFFKLVYPFHVCNSPNTRLAAAAGGCVLLEVRALEAIGGFESLRDAIIDDCTLARRVKDAGYRTWIGLTRSVVSHRRYRGLGDIWRMVARTAFTQLGYSWLLLGLCTLLMVVCFVAPVLVSLVPESYPRGMALAAWLIMWVVYLPTLRFYDVSAAWGLLLPVVGLLFLAMTWDSARRYLNGERSAWRGRRYRSDGLAAPR
ncbi:MAG: glycosyltransferase [Gammaproteobacteria bacterium]|nr:glycosyltransferase [Gammaproteobacteria bacterium]NIM73767.1 glycosyltransferase [Gammaproteobacteria bacterium]NIN39344.1 glycosyltransferase [Gammaproteobacteria bacterium]NIO25009.1 glycosyltransferase [Gammaproteobacteria bacterium]NIO65641.1 glycosyltransferase [Gammaproteobacteria bacterium]